MHLLCEYIYTHTHAYVHAKSLQCVWLFVTLWTIACQASLSIGFSRQEYWRGLPCPPSGDLPKPRIKPESLISSALAGRFFATRAWEARCVCVCVCVCICFWYIYIYIYIYIYLRVRETDNILEGVGHWFNRATFVWYLDQFFSFLLKIISTE